MRALAVLLVSLCSCGVDRIRAVDPPPFVVGVHLMASSVLSDRMAAELKNESGSLWRPYGIHLEWTVGERDGGSPVFSVAAVVDSRTLGPGAATEWAAVLGRAIINHDAARSLPIHLSFEATERMLALRASNPASRIPLVHEREMGRALGRVLAHEIGHLLLGVRGHDDTGLMRPVFRPYELADRERAPFRLACDTVGRLNDRVRELTGSQSRVDGDGGHGHPGRVPGACADDR